MELTNADFNLAVDAEQLDNIFAGLNWITPHYIDEPLNEINLLIDTKNILSKEKEKKIIITDYQFLPIELNVYGNSPIKWYHYAVSFPEMSFPLTRTTELEFSKFLIKKLKSNEIKKIYIVPANEGRVNLISKIIEKKCEINGSNFIQDLYIEMNINCL